MKKVKIVRRGGYGPTIPIGFADNHLYRAMMIAYYKTGLIGEAERTAKTLKMAGDKHPLINNIIGPGPIRI